MSNIPLILFAKAPIAGRVKTRLQSHCSPQQASEIAEILLEQSIIKTTQTWPGEVSLSVWLDHEHSVIQRLQESYRIKLVQQCAGDLGAKMHDALERFGYPAAVMGCDVPHIPNENLIRAHECLIRGDSVIGPSDDGGYYLLGLNRPQEKLFLDMEWGVSSVLENTLHRADAVGHTLSHLDALNDIDEWNDLLQAAQHLPLLMDYLQNQGLSLAGN